MQVSDKTKHVWAGMAIAFVVANTIYFLMSPGVLLSGLLGAVIGILVGFLKEAVYDGIFKKGVASFDDFLATLYGSCAGAVLAIIIMAFVLQNLPQ